ncbi:riboflavin kinase [Patescibacteria group bacterium]|nr:riboflavin kinase [Patescibacteria group bacterium]MCL5798220.1 riboflavin kinase [Patescibacteria group bacterium]
MTNKIRRFWHSGRVVQGKKIGRTIGFPTINLDIPLLLTTKKLGVYAAWVRWDNKIYKGLLYFGPRLVLGEQKNILEIYILNYKKQVSPSIVSFSLVGFIRGPSFFSSLEEMKKQLVLDRKDARVIFAGK